MAYLVLKVVITALLVVAVSEVARRSTLWAGLLASLPLVSLLAMFLLYAESRSVEKVATLATSILWMILPTLPVFMLLPVMLKRGWNFYVSMGLAMALMAGLYVVMLSVLKKLGVAT